MRISLIAAFGTNRVIGNDGKLPWHLPADLKRFRDLTRKHTVLMGRKTAESLGWKPLKNRVNLVLTSSVNHLEIAKGFLPVKKLKDAIAVAEMTGETELFIIGGAQVFELALPIADRLYLTLVHQDFPGDAFFPEFRIDDPLWISREVTSYDLGKKDRYKMTFMTLDSAKTKNYPDD